MPAQPSKETKQFLRDLAALDGAPDRESWAPDAVAPTMDKGTVDVSGGVALECNQAQKLIPGNLLVVFGERCYQLDTNKGEFTFLFELHRTPKTYFWMARAGADGYVYCTLSGAETEQTPQARASFGNWGGLYRVDHHHRKLTSVGRFVDPFGLQLIDEAAVVVADFEGWGPSGKIHKVDLSTGKSEILAEGGYLIDPQGVVMDPDGTLWIANAMHLEHDGSIVKVVPGNRQTVVVPQRGPRSGIVSGIGQHFSENKLVCMIMDWPFMQTSQIFELDKKTLKCKSLLKASSNEPRIWGNGSLKDAIWWVGEAYRKQIVGLDLRTGKIAHVIDAAPITGAVKGIYDSFTFIEHVSVVPRLNPGANSTTRVTVPDWSDTK
jgi:sugar lactone lactonase YvrE